MSGLLSMLRQHDLPSAHRIHSIPINRPCLTRRLSFARISARRVVRATPHQLYKRSLYHCPSIGTPREVIAGKSHSHSILVCKLSQVSLQTHEESLPLISTLVKSETLCQLCLTKTFTTSDPSITVTMVRVTLGSTSHPTKLDTRVFKNPTHHSRRVFPTYNCRFNHKGSLTF